MAKPSTEKSMTLERSEVLVEPEEMVGISIDGRAYFHRFKQKTEIKWRMGLDGKPHITNKNNGKRDEGGDDAAAPHFRRKKKEAE